MNTGWHGGRIRGFVLSALVGCGTSAALGAVILPASAMTLTSATSVQNISLPGRSQLPLLSTTALPTLPLPTPSVTVSVPPVLPTPSMPAASPPAVPTPSLPVTLPGSSPSPSASPSSPVGAGTKPGTNNVGVYLSEPPMGAWVSRLGFTVPIHLVVPATPLAGTRAARVALPPS